MKTHNWTEQIEYLVKRKFPNISLAPIPISLSTIHRGGIDESSRQKLLKDISDYKVTLLKKDIDEIRGLYEAEKNKEVEAVKLKFYLEEQSRFFYQDSAKADFNYWCKMAHWSLDEAIALSFGKNPEIVNWVRIEPLTNISQFAKDYEKRRKLALRAIPWKKLYDPVLPSIFLGWAKELKLDIPELLIDESNISGNVATNWFEEYKALEIKFSQYVATSTAQSKELIDASNQFKNVLDQKQQTNSSNETFSLTPLHELTIKAIKEFFSPRKSIDAKKEEVVEWIVNNGKTLSPPVSVNIAEAIFTIIRPIDHNPRKRRNI